MLTTRFGRYGLMHRMTHDHYVKFVQAGLLKVEDALPKFQKVRVPIAATKPQVVTVKFKGHRPVKAVVLRTRYAGQQMQCVWPAEAKYPGRVYLQWVERWEIV